MRWLLDTNVGIHIVRGYPAAVALWYDLVPKAELGVASVTVAELWHGAAADANPPARRARWMHFLDPLAVVPFDRRAAEIAGDLRHALRHTPIGGSDLFIAATALANGCGVVTANVREFARVPGLAVEDWTAGRPHA